MERVWIITKVFRIKRDGVDILLHPLDLVPEAESWDNADTWERRGYIKNIPVPTPENPVDLKVVNLRTGGFITVQLAEVEGLEEYQQILSKTHQVEPTKRKRGRPRKKVA